MILEGLGAKLLAWALGRGSKYILAVLAVLAVFGYGYMQGVHHVEKAWDKQRAADERVYLDSLVRNVRTREDSLAELRRHKDRASNAETVVVRVPEYITVESARGCIVPVGFVRLFNDAFNGVLPGTGPGADGGNRPIPDPASTGPAPVE